jgi:hypothetical protein
VALDQYPNPWWCGKRDIQQVFGLNPKIKEPNKGAEAILANFANSRNIRDVHGCKLVPTVNEHKDLQSCPVGVK